MTDEFYIRVLSLTIFDYRNTSLDLRDLVDKGLIAVAQNDFQAAFGFFENALKTDGNNTMVCLCCD